MVKTPSNKWSFDFCQWKFVQQFKYKICSSTLYKHSPTFILKVKLFVLPNRVLSRRPKPFGLERYSFLRQVFFTYFVDFGNCEKNLQCFSGSQYDTKFKTSYSESSKTWKQNFSTGKNSHNGRSRLQFFYEIMKSASFCSRKLKQTGTFVYRSDTNSVRGEEWRAQVVSQRGTRSGLSEKKFRQLCCGIISKSQRFLVLPSEKMEESRKNRFFRKLCVRRHNLMISFIYSL